MNSYVTRVQRSISCQICITHQYPINCCNNQLIWNILRKLPWKVTSSTNNEFYQLLRVLNAPFVTSTTPLYQPPTPSANCSLACRAMINNPCGKRYNLVRTDTYWNRTANVCYDHEFRDLKLPLALGSWVPDFRWYYVVLLGMPIRIKKCRPIGMPAFLKASNYVLLVIFWRGFVSLPSFRDVSYLQAYPEETYGE